MKKKSFAFILPILFALLASSCATNKQSGPAGPQGEQGVPGETGPQGPAGEDGQDGQDGKDGEDGTSLLTGHGVPSSSLGKEGDSYIDLDTWDYYVKTSNGWVKQGNIKGSDGEDGQSGTDGETGPEGPEGPQGPTGNDGVSVISIIKTSSDGLVDTYTIYYSNNTTSTFTVTNGANGQDGQQGIQGNPGADGHTPIVTIGENGNWFIDGVDSGVSARGSQGETGPQGPAGNDGADGVSVVSIVKTSSDGLVDTYTITYSDGTTSFFTVTNGKDGEDGSQGEQGIQGEPGSNGHTPVITIGENGNWFIDGVDSGVSAQGPQGPTGQDGQDGQDGADGTSMRTGHGVPANQLGNDGDSYIDLDTWDYYVKENGAWVLMGNIKGADGQDGEPGQSGNEYFTVSFFVDNTIVETQQVAKGEKASRPNLQGNGYTINDWYYLDGTVHESWKFFGYVITENTNLYADYTYNTYIIN